MTYLANLWRILSAFGPVFSSLLEARAVERKEYFISRIVKIFIGKSDMAGLKNIRSVAKTRNLQDKISGALYYENAIFSRPWKDWTVSWTICSNVSIRAVGTGTCRYAM